MWHIDTTVIRLLDGTRAYLHAVIDNFSRRILAWRVADTFEPVNSVSVPLRTLEVRLGEPVAPRPCPLGRSRENREPHVARLDARTVCGSGRRPLAAACRLTDENSPLKVRNFCGNSSARSQRQYDGGILGIYYRVYLSIYCEGPDGKAVDDPRGR